MRAAGCAGRPRRWRAVRPVPVWRPVLSPIPRWALRRIPPAIQRPDPPHSWSRRGERSPFRCRLQAPRSQRLEQSQRRGRLSRGSRQARVSPGRPLTGARAGPVRLEPVPLHRIRWLGQAQAPAPGSGPGATSARPAASPAPRAGRAHAPVPRSAPTAPRRAAARHRRSGQRGGGAQARAWREGCRRVSLRAAQPRSAPAQRRMLGAGATLRFAEKRNAGAVRCIDRIN